MISGMAVITAEATTLVWSSLNSLTKNDGSSVIVSVLGVCRKTSGSR